MSKVLENRIKEISLQYKKNLTLCMKNNNYDEPKLMLYDSAYEIQKMFANVNDGDYSKEKKEILRVNFVLASLERKKSLIIWKEYFFPIEKFWWMRYYTRSTFYRMRKKALEEFMCLY